MRRDITFDTHVQDVVNLLTSEDLSGVVLVAHSSSGAVITAVAEADPGRIAQLVYLDAFVPEHGQSVIDLIAPERRQVLEGLVQTEGDGWLLPRFAPPPWETIVRDMWGVHDENDLRWMLRHLGPTPFTHFSGPVQRGNAAAGRLPRTYIRCPRFANPRFDRHAEMARTAPNWTFRELPAGHHPYVTMPDKTAELLLEVV